jgi:hypothetical protein
MAALGVEIAYSPEATRWKRQVALPPRCPCWGAFLVVNGD